MKIPQKPPDIDVYFSEIRSEPKKFLAFLSELLNLNKVTGPLVRGKYIHWDKLRFYKPPEGMSLDKWWLTIKMFRRNLSKKLPLLDISKKPFNYLLVDPVTEILHEIDKGAGGYIKMPEPITNPQTRDQYYIGSLIQEAITSSQLEGAATTRKVAKEMIRTGRKPQDRSEQMILNNFLTMQKISKFKNDPLSIEMILEIHRLVTEKTLEDSTAAGRLRMNEEQVQVIDMYNKILHDPPPADQLVERMTYMCDFANGKIPRDFIHPVIRSIILHFWLAYDHPFVDGNGRTARALFYWSMIRNGYWLFEFISISQVILKAPAKYGRAFLYSETDDNDLTYFILYHLDVIQKAVQALHEYIELKTKRIQSLENEIRGILLFNHRQRAIINHALRHPRQHYTIDSHRRSHNVVYETSRNDLMDLARRGLLEKHKVKKVWHFMPASDLEEKLSDLP